MLPLILGAIAVGGAVVGLKHLNDKWNKEEQDKLNKLIAEEKKIWNNGKCDQCGKRWHLHWFFPVGSRGEYQWVRIRCYKCKRETTLTAFKPSDQFSQIDRDSYK